MLACDDGHDDCAQALIDAHANIDLTNQEGENALMLACTPASVGPAPGSDESDEQRQERERRLEEKRQSKAWCVQVLLEATVPIRGADFPDRAASFMFACERLQVLGEVLATSHVIEHASVPVEARVVTLTADAQGIITNFARAVLAS
jgi:hypothetical protein